MLKKISLLVLILGISACAMKDERPAVPKDLPPPNHLQMQ